VRSPVRTAPSPGWTIAFDLLLLVGAIVILHIAVSGPIPSGGDGGNWLALAREWLGADVMSAEVVYEPVFIALLASMLGAFGLVNALVITAFLSEALLVSAVYLTVRKASRLPALVAAAMVGAAGYRLEAYAWGAYPQILAVGFAVLAVWAAVRFVQRGRWVQLVMAVAGALVVLFTHKLVAGLMLMAIPAASAHLLWLERYRRELWKNTAVVVGLVWAVGAFFVWSWFGDSSAGVEPTLNSLGLGLGEQLRFAFQEAGVPWIIISVLALVAFGLRGWPRGVAPAVSASFGWLVASVVGFLALGEPRVLLQAQVALLPAAVVVVWRWWRAMPADRTRARRAGRLGFAFFGVALLGSIVLTGLHRYDGAADWYRVAGQRQLEAMAELSEVVEPGDLAVASRGPNGNPVGWWVEGFAGIPTYTSIDTAFLAFPDERAQAEFAAELFSSPPEDAAAMMDEIGARFLILDRRGPDAGWLGGGEPVGLTSLADGTLLILEVSDG
jgi:hypothetical protein